MVTEEIKIIDDSEIQRILQEVLNSMSEEDQDNEIVFEKE